MDSTTLVAQSKADAGQSVKRMQSLDEVCQEVADGSYARGKRYELAGLLVVLVLAKLAGMQSLQGASDWVRDQEALVREGLHLPCKRMPCANTYSYAASTLGQSKGEYGAGSLVRAQGGSKPLRRRAEPFSSTSKRTGSPSGDRWQSLAWHRQASLWGRGATEAGAACV